MTPLASLVPRLRKLRLRSTVVVPFVLELTLAVGLVSYLSFRSSQAAVDDLATQLRSEITARIDGELRRYLGEPHYFDQLNAAAFAQGNFDMQGASNANQFMTQVRMSPYEYSSYVGDAQGRYLGAYRLTYQGSKTIAMAVSNDSTNHHFYFYAMDSRGNRGQLLQQLKPYDPRKRPWYIAASKAKKPVWSDIYLDFASGLPTITASTPVYDAKGRLQGVCATDVVLLENLRSFLQSLSMGPHGQAFIVDPYGQMLTSSSNEPLTVGSGQQAKLLLAKDSQQPLVRETSRYILEEFGGFTNIRKTTQLRYSLGRDQELVQVLPLNDGRGIDWRIVVVIPEADFMGRIYQNSHDNLVLVAGALAIAMIIGVFTAQWITRPLMSLARASEEVAKGNLDQKLDLGSIAEIATVGQAFNRMSEQLKATFEVLAQKNDALAIAEENFHSIFENALEGIFQSLPTAASSARTPRPRASTGTIPQPS